MPETAKKNAVLLGAWSSTARTVLDSDTDNPVEDFLLCAAPSCCGKKQYCQEHQDALASLPLLQEVCMLQAVVLTL